MSDKFQDKYRIPSARAEWWDYRNDAAYFVTICAAGREHYFGEIVETAPIVETLHATSLPQSPDQQPIKNEEMASISPKRGSLSSVIRSYKSAVSKQAREIHADFAWQTRFHDHIICDESEYWKIREYILNNPKRWGDDKYNQPE